jgi:hypothetical protein
MTNRTRIVRPLRRPHFPIQALELFIQLERTPQTDKHYKQNCRRLAALLGLLDEFVCSSVHVNDRSTVPGSRPGMPAHDDWVHIKAIRQFLLAAVAEQRNEAHPSAHKNSHSIRAISGTAVPDR